MVVLVMFLIVLLCNSDGQVIALNDEGYALLSFKQSIDRDPEGALSNWNSSDENPCSWNGITCKDRSAVSVSIPKKKLYGFLPSSLGLLSNLRHLNLRSNQFFGSLPIELFESHGLQSLVLYGNSLSGSIPDEIGKLGYLQTLDLSHNFLNGSIPVSILQCKRLRNLDLSQNNLTGSLPNGVDKALVSLEKLDLSFNKFNGSIPSDMGNLSNLQGTVDLSHNLFSGSIPASLGNLPEKVYIDLTYNNLSGPIPQTGALMNRGPTAFIGNPRLCGPPMKNPCSPDTANSSSSYTFLPRNQPPEGSNDNDEKKARGLSKSVIIAIVVSDVIGICLVGFVFSYCYSKICLHSNNTDESDYDFEKEGKGKKTFFCFKVDESGTPDDVEQHDLVPLDKHVAFDLDELLKASAFVLGKSGNGIVYKVLLEDGSTLAVRRLGEGGSQRFKEFQTEVEAIGKLRHPNIATLRAYYWSVDEKLLIYDYIPNGSLSNALHGNPGMVPFTPLSWPVRMKIIKGIAKGLVYLHEFSPKKYVHGSLKPSNILLGHNMDPQISDFGLVRLSNIAGGSPTSQSTRVTADEKLLQDRPPQKSSSSVSSSTNLGSYYQAPEALKAVKPSQKWDVYAYGVILLEMITGRLPVVYSGTSETNIVQWIHMCIDEKKPIFEVLDPYLAPDADKEEEIIGVLKIAMACVSSSPEKRPMMRHLSDALDRLVLSRD